MTSSPQKFFGTKGTALLERYLAEPLQFEGEVFGCICARKIEPVAATAVRLVVQAPGIRQLDVYEK